MAPRVPQGKLQATFLLPRGEISLSPTHSKPYSFIPVLGYIMLSPKNSVQHPLKYLTRPGLDKWTLLLSSVLFGECIWTKTHRTMLDEEPSGTTQHEEQTRERKQTVSG